MFFLQDFSELSFCALMALAGTNVTVEKGGEGKVSHFKTMLSEVGEKRTLENRFHFSDLLQTWRIMECELI